MVPFIYSFKIPITQLLLFFSIMHLVVRTILNNLHIYLLW